MSSFPRSSLQPLVLLIAIVLSGVFTAMSQPVLTYCEGWNTFYYDTQYIHTVGCAEAVRGFVLQFFAHQWHGILILSLLAAITCMAVWGIMRRVKCGAIVTSIASLIISLMANVGIVCWTTQMSLNTLLPMGGETAANRQFIEGSDMVRNQQWDEIIEYFASKAPVANELHQNLLNMAYAEQGKLGDMLLNQPCQNINAIYVSDIPNYLIAAHLSDVYYSMGHIAQSQRYAFESNEKMHNLSPRMLQRLVQTNIIYEQYEVAKKYLYWLKRTLYYGDWADEHLALIKGADPSSHPLAMKRKCIFADNRFSGTRGLDDDLLQVARNTRGTKQCITTLHYLGSLYILADYTDQFVSMAEEFGDVLRSNGHLPQYFDQYYNHLKRQ